MTTAAATVALKIIYEGLFLMMVPLIMMKRKLLIKGIPNSRLEYKNHTLFMTKLAEKPYPLGLHILI